MVVYRGSKSRIQTLERGTLTLESAKGDQPMRGSGARASRLVLVGEEPERRLVLEHSEVKAVRTSVRAVEHQRCLFVLLDSG